MVSLCAFQDKQPFDCMTFLNTSFYEASPGSLTFQYNSSQLVGSGKSISYGHCWRACGAQFVPKIQDLFPGLFQLCVAVIQPFCIWTMGQIPYLLSYCHPCSGRLEALSIAALLVAAQFIVAFLFTQDNYSLYCWKILAFTTGRLRKRELRVYTIQTSPRRGSFSLEAGTCLLIPALPPKKVGECQ